MPKKQDKKKPDNKIIKENKDFTLLKVNGDVPYLRIVPKKDKVVKLDQVKKLFDGIKNSKKSKFIIKAKGIDNAFMTLKNSRDTEIKEFDEYFKQAAVSKPDKFYGKYAHVDILYDIF